MRGVFFAILPRLPMRTPSVPRASAVTVVMISHGVESDAGGISIQFSVRNTRGPATRRVWGRRRKDSVDQLSIFMLHLDFWSEVGSYVLTRNDFLSSKENVSL